MLVALAASLASPAAAANPNAYNTKTQYLTNHTSDSDPLSCVERRIYLADGSYNWRYRFGGYEEIVRDNFHLGEGWYTWKDCLDPVAGHHPDAGTYIQSTNLDPDNPNWQSVYYSSRMITWEAGAKTWGSYLRPLF
ncbi:hypothetical protein JNW90_27365 [Micromonospora sp. STR1s_5]|nr:hypothetical protein [Micromonospora sp. STR1s_5]